MNNDEQNNYSRPAPEPKDEHTEPARIDEDQGDYIELPDGRNLAPNGAVIIDPSSEKPEILPGYEYTPEKEDLNLMIM